MSFVEGGAAHSAGGFGSVTIMKRTFASSILQAPGCFFDRHAAFLESLLQKAAKLGVVLKESVDQIVVLFKGDELK